MGWTLLIIRKMEVKIPMKYPLTPLRMAIKKKKKSVGEDVEKREPSSPVGRNVNWHGRCGKQFGSSSERLREVLYDLDFHSWVFIYRK